MKNNNHYIEPVYYFEIFKDYLIMFFKILHKIIMVVGDILMGLASALMFM